MRYHDEHEHEKHRQQEWDKEHAAGGFRCGHCHQWVSINPHMGTKNRNHCNLCLWSKHVDVQKGDRRAECQAGMQPVALTFKHEGVGRQGELMLVHECTGCGDLSINRLAADDTEQVILACFEQSIGVPKARFEAEGIEILQEDDLPEIRRQLFGK
jgi:hypothetical protein